MEKSKLKTIYSLLNETGLTDDKNHLVSGFTDGRTIHISEMSPAEANLLIKNLSAIREQKVKKMRAKIIHLLCLYGMVTGQGKPDFDRINRFVQNIGSNNPKKKKLYVLSPREMRLVLNQVDVMMHKELTK